MIGINGGRIGNRNLASNSTSLPGVWSAQEQATASLGGNWPASIAGALSFRTASLGSVSAISNSQTTTLSLSNLISLLNASTFQDRTVTTNSSFTLPGASGSTWSFSWVNADVSVIPTMYIRAQRVSGVNSSWQIQGSGIQSLSFNTGTSSEYSIGVLASSGTATITTTNASAGLFIQDIAFGGGTQGNFLVSWSQA